MARFQRQRGDGTAARASNLELFYDLVFVFAITQVSHLLLDNLSWEGAGQAAVVLLAVWWAWNYTTWATNELDTGAPAVRGLIVAVMLASLLMAVAIPEAWGERALLFAGAYVAIQVGRHSFLAFAAAGRGSPERMRASRILIWFCASGALWIAGALADGPARTLLWVGALTIDYGAPLALYRVPGLRRVASTAWDVVSEHFAERFQLFVIIALGESIVITGATTAELELDAATVAAFVVAFLSSAALWWLYFNRAAESAQEQLEAAGDRTTLARDAYTYLHVLIIAGVILSAVGDELVIAHPGDAASTAALIVIAAGPALYLLALSILRRRTIGAPSPRRTMGAVACLAVALLAANAPALVVSALILAVLVAVIAADEIARHRRVPAPS